uniref:Uncharacterized protein n=1 Tax=Oryza brachyantha TaxID=4533 RepID=J3LC25_ORYBR
MASASRSGCMATQHFPAPVSFWPGPARPDPSSSVAFVDKIPLQFAARVKRDAGAPHHPVMCVFLRAQDTIQAWVNLKKTYY